MVREPIKKSRYLLAFVITLIVFLLGVFLGNIVSTARIEFSENIAAQQRSEYDSLQLQYLYVSEFLEQENCPAASQALDQNLRNLEVARQKLENFIESGNEKELRTIKRDYMLAEIRYWLLSRKAKQTCKDNVVTILYFYSTKNCKDCDIQGAVLTSLKNTFKDKLLIFSIDSNFEDEAMIKIIKDSFNLKTTPSLLINNQPKEEFVSKKELKEIICSQFTEQVEQC